MSGCEFVSRLRGKIPCIICYFLPLVVCAIHIFTTRIHSFYSYSTIIYFPVVTVVVVVLWRRKTKLLSHYSSNKIYKSIGYVNFGACDYKNSIRQFSFRFNRFVSILAAHLNITIIYTILVDINFSIVWIETVGPDGKKKKTFVGRGT